MYLFFSRFDLQKYIAKSSDNISTVQLRAETHVNIQEINFNGGVTNGDMLLNET